MISGILIEGLIYGVVILGVFMTFRILNFCDMTVDGAFPMGACILAACLTAHIHPVIALILAFTGGVAAGMFTTLIYTKLRIPDLLAGILVMTILYSINIPTLLYSFLHRWLFSFTHIPFYFLSQSALFLPQSAFFSYPFRLEFDKIKTVMGK